MKKQIFTFSLIFLAILISSGQTKYRTEKGEINFNASTPLEDIDATNNEVNAIVELESGKFAAVMLIKDFQFRRKLMQEHFNENYLESDVYPKAYFSGIIEGLDFSDSKSEELERIISGKITIHGVERPLKTKVRIKKGKQSLMIDSEFLIKPEDHNIEVPTIVFQKIAREVKVRANFLLR